VIYIKYGGCAKAVIFLFHVDSLQRFLLPHIRTVYEKAYCDSLEILKDLHVSSTPDYEKVAFGMPPVSISVCIYGCASR
jgi:hypothetical protein